ncbi:MAG: 50S ribosomal protein L6 [Chlamydiales bacterium]|nr:50S ribosomal protein L6 [Chlamydiales bacterium]
MSRKAQVPVALAQGVEAQLSGKTLTVKGPKGTLTRELMEGIEVSIEGGQIKVTLAPSMSHASNFLGLYWSLITNMAVGVAQGFEKRLEMIGVGYRAAVQGNLLDLQVGVSHPVKLAIPEGVEVSVEKNTQICVKGIDKQLVGQFSADIRSKRPPEPYKGKGIRYVGEYVRRKAGKAGKK